MKKSKMFSGLRDFIVLWASQSVSSLGTAMTTHALAIWVFGQKGTATSMTLLRMCAVIPSILFSFAAGTLADKWDKKRIMLVADLAAALGTVAVLTLFLTNSLRIWHLYVVNFMLSFMNAFQIPASYVATSLLVPKEHYVRVSGMQSLSNAIVTILAPALGSAVLAFGGLQTVLIADLATFLTAFLILLFRIKIPKIAHKTAEIKESFVKSCAAGVNYLRNNPALLRIILFFSFINFIAHMGGYGMLDALVLKRTGGDQISLGIVKTAVGIGTLIGSTLVTVMKPAKKRATVIFAACGISFLIGDVGQALSLTVPLIAITGLFANALLPFLNANLTAIMRTSAPIEMQGRVFSARDTIQFCTIPVGLFLGGVLTDKVFEPLMAGNSVTQSVLSVLFGTGGGSGIAIQFFIMGITGFITSILCLRNPIYKKLEKP